MGFALVDGPFAAADFTKWSIKTETFFSIGIDKMLFFISSNCFLANSGSVSSEMPNNLRTVFGTSMSGKLRLDIEKIVFVKMEF
mgnify:CR=1 FL=1